MSSQANPTTHQSGMPSALPGSAAAQVVSAVGAKRGRLANLARFEREQGDELKTPVDPLDYCRLNDPDWFKRTQQLVLDLRDGIKRPNSTLTPQMVAHIDANIAKIEMLPIGNQFKAELKIMRKFPDLQVTGVSARSCDRNQ